MNHRIPKLPIIARATALRLCILMAGAWTIIFTGCELVNNAPTIDIQVEDDTPLTSSTQNFTAIVEDLDEDAVSIKWSATDGEFNKNTGETVKWTAPVTTGRVVVTAIADDRKINGTDTATVALTVVNGAPSITEFSSSALYVTLNNTITLTCEALDPDGEDIIYSFFTSPSGVGTIYHESQESNTATWTAPSDPNQARSYDLIVKVSDIPLGYFSTDTIEVLVYSEYGTLWIVDKKASEVSKYTSRGDKILTASHSFQEPVAVAGYRGEFYGAYVADQEAGQIIELDAEGEPVTTFSNLPNIKSLAFHHNTQTLWAISVSENEPRLTVIYTTTEEEIDVEGLRQPNAITINQNRGEVWIADYGYEDEDRIFKIDIREFLNNPPDSLSSANATIFEGNYNGPSSISVRNAQTATVYIADTNDDEIERLTYNTSTGSYSRALPVNLAEGTGPLEVKVVEIGLVWILSLDGNVQYFPENNISSITQIGSYVFADPHAMTADQETGNVWIGDNGRHQVVEITSADTVGITIGGFSFVEDLIINK